MTRDTLHIHTSAELSHMGLQRLHPVMAGALRPFLAPTIAPAPGVEIPTKEDLPVITDPAALRKLDAFLAEEVVGAPCWHCGGPHHPNGCDDAPEPFDPDFEGRG